MRITKIWTRWMRGDQAARSSKQTKRGSFLAGVTIAKVVGALAAVGLVAVVLAQNAPLKAQSGPPAYAAPTGLPSMHMRQSNQPMTLAAASTYYGSPTSGAIQPVDVRVKSAAKGLEADPLVTNDGIRIYEFVRNNFELEPLFGLHKGSAGTLLDKSGGAFDLANLLVDLLRQANITANYKIGTVTMPAAEARSIFRTTSDAQTCQLLAEAGTPAQFDSASPTNCATLVSATSVTIMHVWVEAVIGGQTKVLDPSLKKHAAIAAVRPIWTTLGTTGSSAWSAMSSGVTVGSQVGPVSWNTVNSTVKTASQSLLTSMRGADNGKTVEQEIGGWAITPNVISSTNLLGSLPNGYTYTGSATWTGEVPDIYRAKLRVEAPTGGFDQTFDLPSQIYANRVQVQMWWKAQGGSTVQNPQFQLFIRKCQGLTGTALTSCENSARFAGTLTPLANWTNKVVRLTINHPWAASSGGFGDEAVTKTIEGGKRSEIVVRVGGNDGTRYQDQREAADRYLMRNYVQASCSTTCAPDPDYYEYANDGSSPAIDAAARSYWSVGEKGSSEISSNKDHVANLWWALFGDVSRYTEALGQARIVHQHTLGIVISPNYTENAIDIDTSIGVAATGSYFPHHILTTLATMSSALEGAAIKELAVERVWSTTALGQQVAGPPTTAGPSGNYSAINAAVNNSGSAQIVGPAELASTRLNLAPAEFRTEVQRYLTAGFTVMSQNSASPGGFFAYSTNGEESGWIAYQPSVASDAAAWGTNPVAFRKGAIGSTPPSPYGMISAASAAFPSGGFGKADVGEAQAVFTENADVSVGQGSFPYKLTFQRQYRSSGFAASGGLGVGWTHSFASGGHFALCHLCYTNGAYAPAAAHTIASIQLALEAATHTDMRGPVIAGFVASSWSSQTGQAIDLTVGGNSERFLQMVDAAWDSTSLSGNTIQITNAPSNLPQYNEAGTFAAAPTIVRTLKGGGSSQLFQPMQVKQSSGALLPSNEYIIKTWTYTSGAVVTFTYGVDLAGNGETLRQVSNNISDAYHPAPTLTLSQQDANCASSTDYARCLLPFNSRPSLLYVQASTVAAGLYQKVTMGYGNPCSALAAPCAMRLTSSLNTQSDTTAPQVQRNYAYLDLANQTTGPATGYSSKASDYNLLSRVWNTGEAIDESQYAYEAAGSVVAPKLLTGTFKAHPYAYYAAGFATASVKDPLGNSYRAGFDRYKRSTSYADPLGRKSSSTYDGLGRIVSTTSAWGDQKAYVYDGHNNLTQTTQSPNCSGDAWLCQTITYKAEYDSQDRITKVIKPHTADDPSEPYWQYAYDTSTGQLAHVWSPQIWDATSGSYQYQHWLYAHDAYGRLLSVTDPLGNQQFYDYGQQYASGDPAEAQSCLTQVRIPATNEAWRYDCDDLGRVVRMVDNRGNQTTYTFAKNGLLIAKGGAATAVEKQWVYDLDENLTAEKSYDTSSATWVTSTITRSATGLATATTDIQGRTTRYCYDALDRPYIVADPENRATKTLYNAAGQVIEVQKWWRASTSNVCTLTADLPAGQTSNTYATYTYNAAGLLQSEADARGNATSYSYDGLGRRFRVTYPDPDGAGPILADTEAYAMNERGETVYKQMRAAGATGDRFTRFYYDAAGQVSYKWEMQTGDAYPKGRISAVSRDLDGRVVWAGLYINPTTAYGPLDSLRQYVYDASGRLTQDWIWTDYANHSDQGPHFTYGYDVASNRTDITWPDGFVAHYTYDSASRLTQISFPGGSATYGYDGLSRPISLTRSNTSSTTFVLTTGGDVSTITHAWAGFSGVLSYGYDAAGKVTSASSSYSAWEWLPGASYGRTYGAANSLNQVSSEAGLSLYYDARGNMTGDGQNTYGYDINNRLLSAGRTGMSASYRYDTGDRRITKSVNGVITNTLWSSADEELSETGVYSTVQDTKYIPGLGVDNRLASVNAAGNVTWYYRDKQGSVIAAANNSGAITATSAYSPNGELPLGQSPAGGSFGYTGRQFDAETGLYYNRARYYSPRLAQFLQTDPIGTASDVNLYGYGAQDPINNTDPSGLSWRSWLSGVRDAFKNWFDFGSSGDYPDGAAGSIMGPSGSSVGGDGSPAPDRIDCLASDTACRSQGINYDTIDHRKRELVAIDVGGAIPVFVDMSPSDAGKYQLTQGAGSAGAIALAPVLTVVGPDVGATVLYRAVGPAELADIETTGALRNLGSAEGKYFTTSGEAASSYARQAVRAFGDEPYTVIQSRVPNSILKGMSPVSVDGGIPAYVLPNNSLSGLVPSPLNYSPIPVP